MTAIFGLWRFDGGEIEGDFGKLDAALSIYGNDRRDCWSPDPALMMGRHLRNALPEDRFADPVVEGRRYVVVGDVRLTERDDLARELRLGSRAAQMSDSAMAALAIEHWHEDAFDRIYGAFAIAAWDTREKRLLLARDHLGLKPLFVHFGERFFAFASMPVGLRALEDVPKGADIESMKRFLALENHGAGRTHYEGIGRIMPGHYAVVTTSGPRHRRYWNPDLKPLRLPSHADYVNILADRLEHAVAACLRGAGSKVGAHLSSGFDSTAVAVTAARQLLRQGGTLVAYTAAPREGYSHTLPGRAADESILSAATAAMHPNMLHLVMRTDRTVMANLGRTASIYGMPVPNICNEPWYDAINDDAADRGITVMLEGANGNATISETGMLGLHALMRDGRIVSWLRVALGLFRKGESGPIDILWKSFNPWLPNALYRWLLTRRFGRSASGSDGIALRAEYLSEATVDAASEYSVDGIRARVLSDGWIRPSNDSVSDRLMLLASNDNGAAEKGMLGEWGLDYRDPTADRRLVEFSLRVPVEQLIHDGEPRAMLQKVLANAVPQEVLRNRVRGYQSADWHEGLNAARGEVVEEVARIAAFEPSAKIIDVDRLNALIERWPDPSSDAWTSYATTVDYRSCLLRAISAGSFIRHASAADGAE